MQKLEQVFVPEGTVLPGIRGKQQRINKNHVDELTLLPGGAGFAYVKCGVHYGHFGTFSCQVAERFDEEDPCDDAGDSEPPEEYPVPEGTPPDLVPTPVEKLVDAVETEIEKQEGEAPEQDEVVLAGSLEELTVPKLRNMARDMGVSYDGLKKTALVAAVGAALAEAAEGEHSGDEEE